jgi:hypothetical protein
VTDSQKLEYAKSALRRKFATDLTGLRTLANTVRDALMSGETKVKITNSGFEGGNASGEIIWDAALTGMACEALLLELDPDAVQAPPRTLGFIARFA